MSRLQRSREIAAWLVPGTLLAALPKCPVCLAGYIAIGTGIGLSVTAASYLRFALMVFCVASLSYLAFRRMRHLVGTRK